jgi:tetratricopeptide (TPR) repeat protein
MFAPRRFVVLSVAVLLVPWSTSLAGSVSPTSLDKVPITTSSEPARAEYLAGRDLFEKLKVADSRAHYERAVALDPKFAGALLGLANTQPTAREFNETLARAVAEADHVSPGERLMILSGQAGASGDNAKQIELLKQLIAQYPKDERAQNLYGNALFATQDYAGAIRAYETASHINPTFSQPYNQLGYSYKLLGQPERAEPAFKKYIELIPNDPNPYDSYAELLLKLGRYDESITMYRKALSVDANFIASRFGIATDYDLLQKPKEARAELDVAMTNARDDGQRRAVMFARTVSFAHEGDLAAATKELERQYELGITTNDTLAMIGDQVAIGTIAIEQGDAAAAESRFSQARNLIERMVTIPEKNRENQRRFQLFLSGRVALARNDLAAAHQWCDKFTAQANASGSAGQKRLVHELAGQIALAEKQYAKAITELQLSNLNDPYNLYRLSLAYAGGGKSDKAREYAKKAGGDNTLTSLNYAFVRRALRGNKES